MTEPEPTPAGDQQQVGEVAAAGAAAAAAGEDPAGAMKQKRDDIKFAKLSDEDIDEIAKRFNELNIESFRNVGAFDPPPEPVAPPVQPQAPEQPGEPVPAGEAPGQQPAAPRKFAHRYFGQGE